MSAKKKVAPKPLLEFSVRMRKEKGDLAYPCAIVKGRGVTVDSRGTLLILKTTATSSSAYGTYNPKVMAAFTAGSWVSVEQVTQEPEESGGDE